LGTGCRSRGLSQIRCVFVDFRRWLLLDVSTGDKVFPDMFTSRHKVKLPIKGVTKKKKHLSLGLEDLECSLPKKIISGAIDHSKKIRVPFSSLVHWQVRIEAHSLTELCLTLFLANLFLGIWVIWVFWVSMFS
jgi:hypothetical protein